LTQVDIVSVLGANFRQGGLAVIGTQERWREELFVAGPLSSLIPHDHVLKRVDKVLDLSWLCTYLIGKAGLVL